MEDIRKKYLRKVRSTFINTVIGVILPFLIAVGLLTIINKHESIIIFFDKGDFCTYSVAIFVTSLFLYRENQESIESRIDYFLSDIIIYILIIAAVIYGGMVLLQNINFKDINTSFVKYISVALFSISLLSLYRAILLQFKSMYSSVDVKQESKNEVDSIMRDI